MKKKKTCLSLFKHGFAVFWAANWSRGIHTLIMLERQERKTIISAQDCYITGGVSMIVFHKINLN